MKLKTKLPLFTSITVLFAVVLVAGLSFYNFREKTIEDIETYKKEETEQIKQQLKDVVNMSYDMISASYENAKTAEGLRVFMNIDTATQIPDKVLNVDKIMRIILENLRVIRYGTDGYVWINEINPPYKVVMHAIKPELEGKSQVFYIGENSKQNVYEAFADVCNKYTEGFLEYDFYKPGEAILVHKISYIKLFRPKGWVIGTGVYVDNINSMVDKKKENLNLQINSMVLITLLIAMALISIASTILYFIGRSIINSIYLIQSQLQLMAKGITVEKLDFAREDEIGEIKKSVDLLIDGLTRYSKFAIEIGKGNLDANFDTLSEDDELGNALVEMRQSLRVARVEEMKRLDENQKRNWATEGLAKFAEILRHNSNDIKSLSYNVLANIIDYLKANQGGLFLYNDDNKNDIHLELVATVAYGRKKYMIKKIPMGVGMLGMAALEKQTLYMTNIPEDYLEITSGLGTANPHSLLLVPLQLDEKIFGMLELASFNEFQHHEIEFVEKISETIAITLNSVKINSRTSILLDEFQRQTQEKAAQELEMQLNINELRVLREQVQKNQNQN